ncbi:hypothetical protein BV22DRAFT_1004205 [Leucogyrophana mollusca]|uniref:Uncharacterized protein n=1 Tax=Leucogyrophana mollusca TaxID=85980 RepID=A0ACB8BTD2_9AGAM|nr:hypothetical protein BV22DRAFT_1004205 [Leucogyrophana mollusca]
MSSDSYTILQFLLDRANIQDTITSMTAFLDRRNWDGLTEHVLSKHEVTIDFTQLYGGEIYKGPGAGQSEAWRVATESLTSWQHVTTGVLVDLPQPGEGVGVPHKVKASANSTVTLQRDGTMGDNMIQHGGIYTLELTRGSAGLGSANPWRVSYLHATPLWTKGNMEVVANAFPKST